jgi:hypothetical protein
MAFATGSPGSLRGASGAVLGGGTATAPRPESLLSPSLFPGLPGAAVASGAVELGQPRHRTWAVVSGAGGGCAVGLLGLLSRRARHSETDVLLVAEVKLVTGPLIRFEDIEQP